MLRRLQGQATNQPRAPLVHILPAPFQPRQVAPQLIRGHLQPTPEQRVVPLDVQPHERPAAERAEIAGAARLDRGGTGAGCQRRLARADILNARVDALPRYPSAGRKRGSARSPPGRGQDPANRNALWIDRGVQAGLADGPALGGEFRLAETLAQRGERHQSMTQEP